MKLVVELMLKITSNVLWCKEDSDFFYFFFLKQTFLLFQVLSLGFNLQAHGMFHGAGKILIFLFFGFFLPQVVSVFFQVLSLGFDLEAAQAALSMFQGDVQLAVEELLKVAGDIPQSWMEAMESSSSSSTSPTSPEPGEDKITSLAPGIWRKFRIVDFEASDWWFGYFLWNCPQMNVTAC